MVSAACERCSLPPERHPVANYLLLGDPTYCLHYVAPAPVWLRLLLRFLANRRR